MSPSNVVATVFKVVILSIVLMVVVASAVNIFLVFDTQSKIDVIGTNMSNELSRNNAILYESRQTFVEQLEAITTKKDDTGAEIKNGFGNNGVRYTLKGITVEKPGDTAPTVLSQGTALTTYNSADDYYKAVQGEYGDFMTLKLTYSVNFDFFTYVSENQNPNGTGVTMGVNPVGLTLDDVVFEYTVPCLRYNKT